MSEVFPFELHISISQDTDDEEAFVKTCKRLKVKPTVLHLHRKDAGPVIHTMTSSVMNGTFGDAMKELNRLSDALRSAGMTVERTKIETVPWHPKTPRTEGTMPKGCYFEAHFKFMIFENQLPMLRAVASGLGCHVSQNVFKRHTSTKFMNTMVSIMATYRDHVGTMTEFMAAVNSRVDAFKSAGFTVVKKITEFAIWDSREEYDAEWMAA